MRPRLTFTLALVGVGIALSALAGEPRRSIDASRALDAGPSPLPDIVITRTPADPPPLLERWQWVFDLRWDRGDVWLVGLHRLELALPQATPRALGRFALELYEGNALVERVRFDFPLLGASEADGGVSLSKKLRTRIGVVFPATTRGTRLELWDRATSRRWALAWPAHETASSPLDAGALAAPASGADGGM